MSLQGFRCSWTSESDRRPCGLLRWIRAAHGKPQLEIFGSLLFSQAIPLYTVAMGRRAESSRGFTTVHSVHFNETIQLNEPYSEGIQKVSAPLRVLPSYSICLLAVSPMGPLRPRSSRPLHRKDWRESMSRHSRSLSHSTRIFSVLLSSSRGLHPLPPPPVHRAE